MIKISIKYLSFILIVIVFARCSKLNDELVPAPEVKFHGEGVFNPSSPDYHGKLVVDSPNGIVDCQQCHALDYSGGITKVGCNNISCHPTINVHVDGIIDPTSNNFHGSFIKGILWDIRDCNTCHADDYSGGLVSPTCQQCHTFPNGPEACNTCHGDFNDIDRIAPPIDLDNDSLTTSPGVGAHVKHLYDNQLGSQILCSNCHKVPQEVYDAGHVDSDLPAEIIFGNLATYDGGVNASYNFSNATCSDVYCHGSFEFLKDSSSNPWVYTEDAIVGNSFVPQWNKVDSTQAVCGSCHALPPTGHQSNGPDPNATTCVTCHPGVVDVNGNIIDQTKHINGMKNIFGN